MRIPGEPAELGESAEQDMPVSAAIPALERVVLAAGAGMIVTTALPKEIVKAADPERVAVIVAPETIVVFVEPGKTAAVAVVGTTVVFVEQKMAVPIAVLKGIAEVAAPEMVAASGEIVMAAAPKGIAEVADLGKAVVVVASGEVVTAAVVSTIVATVARKEIVATVDPGKVAVVVQEIAVLAVPAKTPGRAFGDYWDRGTGRQGYHTLVMRLFLMPLHSADSAVGSPVLVTLQKLAVLL